MPIALCIVIIVMVSVIGKIIVKAFFTICVSLLQSYRGSATNTTSWHHFRGWIKTEKDTLRLGPKTSFTRRTEHQYRRYSIYIYSPQDGFRHLSRVVGGGGGLQIVHTWLSQRRTLGVSGDKKVWGTYQYRQEHLESRTHNVWRQLSRGGGVATQTLLSSKLTHAQAGPL